MNKIFILLKNLISVPFRLFSKKTVFCIISNSNIHKSCAIKSGTRIYNSTLNKYTYIGRNGLVQNSEIGSFCSIADNCSMGLPQHNIYNFSTSPVFSKGKNILKKNFADLKEPENKKTFIGNDVWIGINVCIMQGLKIGTGAVIGAGSIVTKDVPPYAVIGGVPARVIKYRFDNITIEKLLSSKWWEVDENELANKITDLQNEVIHKEIVN